MEALFILASIGFVVLLFTAAYDLYNPDPDLDGPWDPGDRPWWRP